MKWRDWQLLIILVLLGYIALSIAFLSPGGQRPAKPASGPSPTARGALASPAIRIVAPTSTPHPSSTPVPTATFTQEPTVAWAPTTTSTPTPSVEPQPTATPTPEVFTHVVQKGENLLRIAERYGVTMQSIVERNGLANPDLIYIGQTLVIPLPAPLTPSPTPPG